MSLEFFRAGHFCASRPLRRFLSIPLARRIQLSMAMFMSATGMSIADVTRDQAVETVLKIVVPATLKEDVSVYLSAAPLRPGMVVRPFGRKDGAITVQKASWFAYIDDEPFAFFSHPVRFVLIDAVSGEVTIEGRKWWPLVDDKAPFSQEAVDADPQLLVFSTRNLKDSSAVLTP